MKAGLSAAAGAVWYALKPSGKGRIIVGSDNSTNVDNSTHVTIINIGPLIEAVLYFGSSTITYIQTFTLPGQKTLKYGMHLLDSMVQWRQSYDNELIQGPLMDVWETVIIQPVQERIKSAHAVICLGVADDLGSKVQDEERLAGRRAANLEIVAASIRQSENRVHSLNLGQWLKGQCSQKRVDWDNQRRVAFITIDGDADEADYLKYVRDAADRLRSGLKEREKLKDNPTLEEILQDNETLMDMYLNCYSQSRDWHVI